MRLNLNKTQVMAVAEEEEKIKIMIEDKELKQEKQFQYLGIIIEEKGNLKLKANERMEKALRMYYVMNRKSISKK